MRIIEKFYESKNIEDAVPMSAYMKNKFPFLGLKKPERQLISKDFLKQRKMDESIDWEFVQECWQLPEREFQYLALTYLVVVKGLLTPRDISKLEQLIVEKSWWDSVDSIAPLVGALNLKHPEIKEHSLNSWIEAENIWLKRASIICQLKYKEKTDLDFLSKAIIFNKETGEFFIDKAIGWALREYSRTDKIWVKSFIEANQLSKLSIREGSKYI